MKTYYITNCSPKPLTADLATLAVLHNIFSLQYFHKKKITTIFFYGCGIYKMHDGKAEYSLQKKGNFHNL